MTNDLNTDNCIQLFCESGELLGRPDFGMSFIRENTEEVLMSDAFYKMPANKLLQVMKDDNLSASEAFLFSRVIEWGRYQLQDGSQAASVSKQTLDESKSEEANKEFNARLKVVIAKILPCIRFPLMETFEIATIVVPTMLLSDDELVLLYQYAAKIAAGTPSSGLRLPAGLSIYSDKPREGIMGPKESTLIPKNLMKEFMMFFNNKERKKPVKPIKFQLLYTSQKHGTTAHDFHSKCDDKGPVVVIYSSKGNIFGGYYGDSWKTVSSYGTASAWLFSLVNPGKNIMKLLGNGSNHNYQDASYGPTWGGGHDLYCPGTWKTSNGSSNPSSYTRVAPGYSGVFSSTTFTGSQSFKIDDFEVFAVTDKNK
jgi:hypothetical protein